MHFYWIRQGQGKIEETGVLFFELHQREAELACFSVRIAKRSPSITLGACLRVERQGVGLCLGFCFDMRVTPLGMSLLFLCGSSSKGRLSQDVILSLLPPIDPLLFSEDLCERLQTQNKLIEWNPLSHAPSLISFFPQKERSLDMRDHVLQEGIVIRSREPIESLTLTLRLNWVKQVEGEIDVFPCLLQAFKSDHLKITNNPHFEEHWPQKGQRVGVRSYTKTGYWVSHSSLKRIGDTSTKGMQTISYSGSLRVMWRFKVPIEEKLKIVICPQHIGVFSGRHLTLPLPLRIPSNLKDFVDGQTFFQSKRAQDLLVHVKEYALAILRSSQRSLEVVVRVFLGDFLSKTQSLSCSQTVHVFLEEIGDFFGKITAYYLHVDAYGEVLRLTLEGMPSSYQGLILKEEGGVVESKNVPPVHVEMPKIEILNMPNQDLIQGMRIHFDDLRRFKARQHAFTLTLKPQILKAQFKKE